MQIVGYLFAVIVLVWVFLVRCSGEPSENELEEWAKLRCESTSSALINSRDIVRRHLKEPSNASFPSSIDDGVNVFYEGDCTHKVYAYVDAENSFGATVRNEYYIRMKNVYGTYEWEVLDIAID